MKKLGKRDGHKALVAVCILMDVFSDDDLEFTDDLRILDFRRDLRRNWKEWGKKEFRSWGAFVEASSRAGEYSIREMGWPPQEPTDEAEYIRSLQEIVAKLREDNGAGDASRRGDRAAPVKRPAPARKRGAR